MKTILVILTVVALVSSPALALVDTELEARSSA